MSVGRGASVVGPGAGVTGGSWARGANSSSSSATLPLQHWIPDPFRQPESRKQSSGFGNPWSYCMRSQSVRLTFDCAPASTDAPVVVAVDASSPWRSVPAATSAELDRAIDVAPPRITAVEVDVAAVRSYVIAVPVVAPMPPYD